MFSGTGLSGNGPATKGTGRRMRNTLSQAAETAGVAIEQEGKNG